jgi:hypothetical protein
MYGLSTARVSEWVLFAARIWMSASIPAY